MKNGNGKNGRPPININWEEFEKLCFIQCSLTEIADWFSCSNKTIERKCYEQYGESFVPVFEKKRVGGLINLRRNMFKMSEKNPAVAIFLAKNLLGMSDKQETMISGDPKRPVNIKVVTPEAKKLTEEILKGKGTD